MCLLIAVRFIDPGPVQSLRLAYFDQLQKWQPRAFGQLPVRVVDIDELSLDEQGQWPWPRDKLADMVDRLRQAGAAVVSFDVLFLETDRLSPSYLLSQPNYARILADADISLLPDNDISFAQMIKGKNVVLGVAADAENESSEFPQKAGLVEIGSSPSRGFPIVPGFTPPIAPLAEAAAGLGSLNMNPDDTVSRVRTVPMMWKDINGNVIPSLAVETLRVATGQQSIIVQGANDLDGVTSAIRVGPFNIPTSADGSFMVRFRPDEPSLYVSAHAVLTEPIEALRASLEGTIVLIGTSAAGLSDIRTTAIGEDVPGVSVHAQIIEQILQQDFIKRDDFIRGAEILTFLVLGTILLWIMALSGPFISMVTGGAIGGLIVFSSWMLFQERTILYDVTFPLFGVFIFFTAMTSFQFLIVDREKKRIRGAFGQYVSPDLVNQLSDNPDRLILGGERRTLSILFSDVRGFTTISESFRDNPAGLTALMNRFLTVLSEAILHHGGTIDKFMGDAVMAFWNAPLDHEDHVRSSCRAALKMLDDVEALNAEREREHREEGSTEVLHRIDVGVGINTGDCLIGNMGSAMRFDYTALGDAVNLASRLEGQSKTYGVSIILGGPTAHPVAEEFAVIELDLIRVKGKNEPAQVFGLFGDETLYATPEFQALSRINASMLSAYRGQDWAEAAAQLGALEEAAKALPFDLETYLALYRDRLSDSLANPVAVDWDGVFAATSK